MKFKIQTYDDIENEETKVSERVFTDIDGLLLDAEIEWKDGKLSILLPDREAFLASTGIRILIESKDKEIEREELNE
jgi:hypothetical protein